MKIYHTLLLLKNHRPDLVDELLKNYPDQREFIKKGNKNGDQQNDLRLSVEASISALVLIKERMRPNLEAMRVRLAKAKRFRLIANITVSITSVGLITLIMNNKYVLSLVTALINAATSITLLLARDMETSKIGEANLIDNFQNMVDLLTQAESIHLKLEKELNKSNFNSTTEHLLLDTEILSTKLFKIELSMGLLKIKY